MVCVDLDRTLIYSPSALLLDVPDHAAPRLLCVEVYRGAPLSFMTETAAAALVELARVAVLVPTTTRTPEQLARVNLPGPHAPFAIASNGGHLLAGGVEDAAWTSRVRAAVAGCAPADEVDTYVRSSGAAPPTGFLRSVRVASGLFVYAVVERANVPAGWLAALSAWCAERGWVTSLQGRKVYCVPAPLTKSAAALEVVRRTGAYRWLAAGDSLLDAELLVAADEAVRPAHGELAESRFTSGHLHVTVARGVLAGEELTAWLLARVGAPESVGASASLR